LADTVGAGSEDFGKEGRKVNGSWRDGLEGLRDKTQKSIEDVLSTEKQEGEKHKAEEQQRPLKKHEDESGEDFELRKAIAASLHETTHTPTPEPDADADADLERAMQASMADPCARPDPDLIPPSNQADYYSTAQSAEEASALANEDNLSPEDHQPKQIFHSLVFYVNGSTAPLISDHRLKYLISSRGGHLSISHARKQVTHVIIGNPHNHHSSTGKGTGGALASTKIQREITRHRGKGVKFVGAQWIIDSVHAGKRMAETRYENVKLGGAGQGSVFDKFKNAKPGTSGPGKSQKTTGDISDEELGFA
jgi:hypothetical protein